MRKFYPFVLLLVLLYFILFPQNIAPSVDFKRNWRVSLREPATVAGQFAEDAKIVRSGSLIFRLDSRGTYKMLEHVRYAAAVSDDYFINYDAVSQALIVLDGNGRYHTGLDTRGYPYFSGGRLFVLTTDRGAMREWSIDGEASQSISFPSILSSLSASPFFTAAGFINGEVCLYGNGDPVFLETPEISRYSAVYGIAAAQTVEAVAVVSGIDPQFLTVYAKSDGEFIPVSSQSFGTDFRRPVYLRFFNDDAYLLIETGDGIAILDTKDWKRIKTVELAGFYDAAYDRRNGLFLFSSLDGMVAITSPTSAYSMTTYSGWGPVRFGNFDSSFFLHKDGLVCDLEIVMKEDV